MQVRPLSERTQAPRGVSDPNRGARLETPEKAEKPEQERSAQERPSGSDRPERSERSYRNRTADRAAEGNTERTQGREKACSERERAARVSGAERAADRRSGNRAVPENENGKTARLWKAGAVLSAVHRAEENGQKWRKMRS